MLHYNVGSVDCAGKTADEAFWRKFGESKIRLDGTVMESDGEPTGLNEETNLATILTLIEERCKTPNSRLVVRLHFAARRDPSCVRPG